MKLIKSSRTQAKIKLALQGPSGSGKTYSALLLAYGLCKDWSKIAVIDTENNSSHLYAHLGEYYVLNVRAPYTPERYIEAIKICEEAGSQVIIIDSLSHEWDGEGGLLEYHSQLVGNSFTNWSKLTPRHASLVQKILTSSCHVIATVRSKQEYVLSEKNGKQVPEKIGMKAIQRDGLEYDFTIVFEIDIHHNATCTKDRTQLFPPNNLFEINCKTGEEIADWCKNSFPLQAELDTNKIYACKTLEELCDLYNKEPILHQFRDDFTQQATFLKNEKISTFN